MTDGVQLFQPGFLRSQSRLKILPCAVNQIPGATPGAQSAHPQEFRTRVKRLPVLLPSQRCSTSLATDHWRPGRRFCISCAHSVDNTLAISSGLSRSSGSISKTLSSSRFSACRNHLPRPCSFVTTPSLHFLNCTKNIELTARSFARTFTFALSQKLESNSQRNHQSVRGNHENITAVSPDDSRLTNYESGLRS
jgi:hypothetical protein